MGTFRYEAQDHEGKRIRGQMAARTPAEVTKHLRDAGLLAISVEAEDAQPVARGVVRNGGGMSLAILALFLAVVLTCLFWCVRALSAREERAPGPDSTIGVVARLRGVVRRLSPGTMDLPSGAALPAVTANRPENVAPVVEDKVTIGLPDQQPVSLCPAVSPVSPAALEDEATETRLERESPTQVPAPAADAAKLEKRAAERDRIGALIKAEHQRERELDSLCRRLATPRTWPIVNVKPFGQPDREKGECSPDEYKAIMRHRADADGERRSQLQATRRQLADVRTRLKSLRHDWCRAGHAGVKEPSP